MAKATYKRVFTLGFAVSQIVTSPGDDADTDEIMVAEEDIIIIGYQMAIKMGVTNRLSGEGVVDCDWVLSTSSRVTGAAVIGWGDLHCQVEEFTAGAAMTATYPHPVVMFPAEHGVPMREGEALNLIHSMHAVEHAGDVQAVCDGTIYYVRGKAVS